MMKRTEKTERISVLVVDDSLVFRRFLRDIFENAEGIEIVGEAKNGIEALDLVLKVKPDVILMDLEMPLMDGMTALQHLMIHCPTPTIMFSSLTNEGTARCFDTLKNGAIDFICKDFMFEEENLEIYKNTVIRKVIGVAGNRVRSIEAFVSLQGAASASRTGHGQQVIFCEECGTRQIIEGEKGLVRQEIRCLACGDVIEVNQRDKFRRNSFLTVLAGGRGSYRNLLNIIPRFDADMGGAMVVVIFDDIAHVSSFAEYLNSICQMKVLRARENMCLDGGNCYIVSSRDLFCLKPFSANYSFQRLLATGGDADSLDLLLTSVAGKFRNRSAGVILSGDDIAGVKGMQSVVKAQGTALVLDPADCLYKRMGQVIREKCPLNRLVSEEELVEHIQALHYQAKRTVSTA